MSKKYRAGICSELQELFTSNSPEGAKRRKDEILADHGVIAEEAMKCLDEGFENALTVMALPVYMRKYYRTSNQIEHLNKELKRRSKVIGVFPNEDSLIRLMGTVLLERNEILSSSKRVFKCETNRQLSSEGMLARLGKIADEQKLLVAA